jgi:hypothetical protein
METWNEVNVYLDKNGFKHYDIHVREVMTRDALMGLDWKSVLQTLTH